MKKIVVTIGISGSGKSTYAHNLWETSPNDYVIINRDKLRELLFGFTECNISERYWGLRTDINSREKQVTKYQNLLISEALSENKVPIVDATHLTYNYIKAFEYWNVNVEFVWFNVPVDVAEERISRRTRKVSREFLEKQKSQLKTLLARFNSNPGEFNFEPTFIEQDENLPGTVLVDIDGTLAHMSDRSPYDWKRVGEDTEDPSVGALVRKLQHIIICTGRDGSCEAETKAWLRKHNIPYDELYIRKAGDQRPDWVVKEEMWREIAKRRYIKYLVDDRMQVVRRARALGLKVFNVEYNNF